MSIYVHLHKYVFRKKLKEIFVWKKMGRSSLQNMQKKGMRKTKSQKIYKRLYGISKICYIFFKNKGEMKLQNLTFGIVQ